MGRLAQLQQRLQGEGRDGGSPTSSPRRGWRSAVELVVLTVRDSLDYRVPGLPPRSPST
ncbi:MAG: hypothetical protein M3O70_21845 [Actinomycetota bacterium]|nr:hypothetical protein [Actinomycetota bacterium]